jgi:outer membrane protein OmpA-like peptidoglycan-associated protein
MLDQVVKILNKYPGKKLDITVHTDNTGLPDIKLSLSQNYAQTIVTYLINRGIDSKRLVAKGLGGTRPIASNYLEKERVMNRRVEISIIKE